VEGVVGDVADVAMELQPVPELGVAVKVTAAWVAVSTLSGCGKGLNPGCVVNVSEVGDIANEFVWALAVSE
jgi:hypothetical protein